jgi:hypothetical protein
MPTGRRAIRIAHKCGTATQTGKKTQNHHDPAQMVRVTRLPRALRDLLLPYVSGDDVARIERVLLLLPTAGVCRELVAAAHRHCAAVVSSPDAAVRRCPVQRAIERHLLLKDDCGDGAARPAPAWSLCAANCVAQGAAIVARWLAVARAASSEVGAGADTDAPSVACARFTLTRSGTEVSETKRASGCTLSD